MLAPSSLRMGEGTRPSSTSSKSCRVWLWSSCLSVSPNAREVKFHLITLSPVGSHPVFTLPPEHTHCQGEEGLLRVDVDHWFRPNEVQELDGLGAAKSAVAAWSAGSAIQSWRHTFLKFSETAWPPFGPPHSLFFINNVISKPQFCLWVL